MHAFINSRSFFLAMAVACLGLLGFGFYLEHVQGLEPCPLCMLQRMAFFAILLIAAIATLHGPALPGRRIYCSLLLLVAAVGTSIAGRQIWLQHLPPDQVPECGPGLDFILDAFPPGKALEMILSGSGECAEIQWQFLSLSIAGWSLVWFLIFALAAVIGLVCGRIAGDRR